ncbi:MAG: hypothetical protein CML22_09915 [Rheinheimera sp.]|nr:hypothetical protein [Rheinheimera sp.]MBM34606.1 hypothetical protein [Rheinheimera sp.]HAW94332.1 hypothetical protein [Candidatus Azambacteria bacterium]|tara:strand:- start:20216 stop:21193 length:978 start_codon:yes stop_codon:yes gene_type:complete
MWFNHPKFYLARNELMKQLDHFKSSSSKPELVRRKYFGSEPLPKIIFICGGDEKNFPNRLKVENYIKKHSKNNLTFRAEYAWETIVESKKKTVNALELEDWLADFSDVVLILVESFGTVAELGAFSMGPDLRKKLLPILNKKFEKDESFINTGPVRWVNNDSKYGPCIHADFDSILTCMPDVLERVDVRRSKIYASRSEEETYGELKFTRKEMLFLVVLVIISIGPVSEDVVVSVFKEAFNIKGKSGVDDIEFFISLSVALKMTKKAMIEDDLYYFCKDYNNLKNSIAVEPLLNLSQSIRSRCLSHLVYIKDYINTLEAVHKIDS